MAVLFAGAVGRVIAMTDPAEQGLLPALVDVERGALSFQQRKTLITRIAMSQETNQQFAHMLGGAIFVYVFGDRIGQVTISGLAVAYDCDRGGDRQHGVEKLLGWFNSNKLSRRRTPVTVMLGQTPLQGFLTGLQADLYDHRFSLMQYNLSMFVPPAARSD